MRLLSCLALVLLCLPGCRERAGAIHASVRYTGFHPGCLRVSAWSAQNPNLRDEKQVAVESGSREAVKDVAIYAGPGWGPSVEIEAIAREVSCEGAIVARDQAAVTIPEEGVEPVTLTLAAIDLDGDGYVWDQSLLKGTDCNDADETVHKGAPEICDLQDNDCDGVADDLPNGGGCSRWEVPDRDLVTVSHAPGTFGAWVAGMDQSLAFINGGVPVDFTGDCAGNWRGSWAHPTNGHVYLGGQSGRLADHGSSGGACVTAQVPSTTTQVNGMLGFPDAGFVYAVTSGAHVYTWNLSDGGINLMAHLGGSGTNLRDLHGVSPQELVTAGWNAAEGNPDGGYFITPALFRYSGSTWTNYDVDALTGRASIFLHGVYMVRPNLAYAVGTEGVVLKWDGAQWSTLPPPPGKPELMSVLAFGESSVYVVSVSTSQVLFWDGQRWTTVLSSARLGSGLRDITGTGPENLWVVGPNAAWQLSHRP